MQNYDNLLKHNSRTFLADSRVDPSAFDNYALRMASKNGHLEIVELLEGNNFADS
jgi:hypothetical protein